MWTVDGSSARILIALIPLIPGNLMSSGRHRQGRARNFDAADAVPRTEQADIGPARDKIFNQHQIAGLSST
jgi:hypothetical protein